MSTSPRSRSKEKAAQAKPVQASPIGAKTPVDHDRIQAAVIGVDQAWRDVEATWGAGRLPALVSDATRLSLRRGMDAWQTALTYGDADVVENLAPKIRAALVFMEREATTLGHAKLTPEVWETRREDGTVIAIVRTQAEASAVVRDGRALEVWTLEEIARVLPANVTNIKKAFPGARVSRVVSRDEGFAQEWVTADPCLGILGEV